MFNFSNIQTPYYLYNIKLLEQTLENALVESQKYGFHLHYALKANNDNRILETIKNYNFGTDCVSGNEIKTALKMGFSKDDMFYTGVGKTDNEIILAIESEILGLNCESIQELEVISEIAHKIGKTVNVALRINPDISANTHQYISTGKEDNKFGISVNQLQIALDFCESDENLNFIGLHFHIGSQITDMKPFIDLCNRVNLIWDEFHIEKYGGKIINLGGGLGINYTNPNQNLIPDFQSFFEIFANYLYLPESVQRHFELGRSLVGQCGSLITRVLYVKNGGSKKHIIADSGMTELIRPALYGSYHKIENLSSSKPMQKYDVVGPVCESSDFLGKEMFLPETSRGDLLKIYSCGAYVETMAMNYNMRDLISKTYM